MKVPEFNSPDYNRVMFEIASEFSRLLLAEIGAEKLAAVIAANKVQTDKEICHSHDYTDANVIMAEAWDNVMHSEIDLQSDSQTGLWNDAWREAKDEEFFYE